MPVCGILGVHEMTSRTSLLYYSNLFVSILKTKTNRCVFIRANFAPPSVANCLPWNALWSMGAPLAFFAHPNEVSGARGERVGSHFKNKNESLWFFFVYFVIFVVGISIAKSGGSPLAAKTAAGHKNRGTRPYGIDHAPVVGFFNCVICVIRG